MILILMSPSILSADFSELAKEAVRMEKAGAEWLHIDVMDGHFVPNISLGAPVVKCLRPKSSLVFDVHLMISEPSKYINDFVKAGADLITFHLESEPDHIDELIAQIRKHGLKVGISIKPKTPAEAIYPYLDKIDMVLVMTVEPGFGGQIFMADMMPKIKAIRKHPNGTKIDIQVDGGINPETVKVAAEAGANVFVAGNAVFKAEDSAAAVKQMKENAAASFKG